MISIITATYNREKLLHNLYQSINDNYKTYKDIEWIIVDDGSTDNTKEEVNKWIKEAYYKIKYIYQDNAGKMAAINNGIKETKGNIIIEMDSDDTFLKNSLEMVSKDFESLEEECYGIIYKRKSNDFENTVNKEIDNKVIKLFDIHNRYGYSFDMTICFKADIRKKYFYELEKNERFITEAYLYYQLDNKYKGLLFKDKELILSKYMEDGYSKNIKEMFLKYPKGYYKYFKYCLSIMDKNTLKKRKLYFIKHYILFSYLNNLKMSEAIKNVKGINKLYIIFLIIPGYIKAKKFR